MSYIAESRFFLNLFFDKTVRAYKSWTIIFNTSLLLIIPLLDAFQTQLPVLREFLPSSTYSYIFFTTVIVNILLRYKTIKPLENL